MEGCVFCRIADRRSSAYIVEETQDFLCFFPIKPDCFGHVLIVSRKHFPNIIDCPPELGAGLFEVAQALFRRYRDRFGATGFNLLNANGQSAGQSVDHLHFHFLPRFANDGLNAWPDFPVVEADLDDWFERLMC
ncbi:HIT family protein [Rhizobium sp. CSW-27]|uniref:HIT family protein n=1 Tax=Rhizobium sp. CSW-27 TaxID=2839985 RepID=UPI001C018062|nr:HIT family protein [Rhizobium sp. CSW-27]MBT9372123.1 HIT family protein [Rhizobium sp. CSW-27]